MVVWQVEYQVVEQVECETVKQVGYWVVDPVVGLMEHRVVEQVEYEVAVFVEPVDYTTDAARQLMEVVSVLFL